MFSIYSVDRAGTMIGSIHRSSFQLSLGRLRPFPADGPQHCFAKSPGRPGQTKTEVFRNPNKNQLIKLRSAAWPIKIGTRWRFLSAENILQQAANAENERSKWHLHSKTDFYLSQ